MADLTLRLTKGSPVTFAEMDSNLIALDSESPWKVSDGHITYQGKVGIGYGTDSNYRPTYHLDFGFGDSNGEVKVGTFADLGLHLDSSSSFSIYNDGLQSVTVDDQGRLGVGISVPNQPLDVAGNIQSTATVIANQGFFQSVYDGFMTISNGSISNGVDATMSGTVSFGQLSDQTNTITRFEIDKVSGSAAILPASSAVKFSIDSAVASIDNAIDSEHAWANNYITNVDSNAIARDDSDRTDLIAQIDSDHAWANNYISNVDTAAQARDDSEHDWALSYLGNVDSALDSEHAWNVLSHNTLQNNIDSEHGYAHTQTNLLNARADSEHGWANSNFDSEHTWNVASHNQLQANIDSDHLWALRKFDSEHGYAVGQFDSEHFWAKKYVEDGDSVVDSQLQKQFRIQKTLDDSEHAWNVAAHGELQQNIDSRADSEHRWNVAENQALQADIDSEHAWANNYISTVDIAANNRDDSEHAWASNYISTVDTTAKNRDDSEHAWANNYISTVDIAANNRDDSEHAWANNYIATVDTNAQNRDDSEHAWASNYIATVDTNAQNRDDSDHQWAVTAFASITTSNDSEHAWNVAEHTQLRSEIDSNHAWANTNFSLVNDRVDSDRAYTVSRLDSEHLYVVTSFSNLTSNQDSALDSDHAWAVSQFDSTWNAIRAIDSDNDADRAARLDSEHAWNITEHTQLRAEIDSDHAWAVSQFDSEHSWNVAEHLALSNADSNLGDRLDSLSGYVNTFVAVEIAKLDSNLDSEHAWNVAEHDALQVDIDSVYSQLQTLTAGVYNSSDFDSDLATKTSDDVAEGTTNLYYTQGRAQTDFDSGLATKTTDDVAEGTTNLYYTTARTDSDAKRAVSAGNGLDYDSSTGVFRTDSTASVQFDNLVLSGDLTVNGTTNTINVENLNVSNSRIGLNDSLVGAPTNDAGIIINRGTDSNAFIGLDETNDKFTLGFTVESAGENGIITDLTVGTLVANIEGNVTGQVSDISNHTTDGLAEGTTNLYYTQARAQTDFDSGLATKTTTDVAEGTNLYYTVDRWDSALDSAISAGKISAAISGLSNTDSLPEGTNNLYYTQARAQTDFDSGFATKTTDDLSEGTTNVYYTQARAQTDFDSGLATKTTDDLGEGTTNVYYTTARFDSALDSAIGAGKIATENYNNTDSLPEGTTNLYYSVARSDSDFSKNLDSAIAAGEIATLSNTDSLPEGTTNLYYTTARQDSDTLVQVDSDYVQARQQYVTLDSTAPTTPFDGELWLDRNVDAVKIYDGSVWFDLPTSSTFNDSNIILRLNGHDSDILRLDSAISSISGLTIDSTQPASPIDGDLWLDKNVDLVKIYDGSVWFDFPVGAGFDDSNIIVRLNGLDSDVSNISGLTIDSTQPSGPIEGDLWLDKNVDLVKIYDGSIWFELPTSAVGGGTDSTIITRLGNLDSDVLALRNADSDILATIDNISGLTIDSAQPASPIDGDLWLDKNVDTVKIYDGSVWFDFPASGGGSGTIDSASLTSMIDSDYVQLRQNYMEMDSTAPSTAHRGEFWLDRNEDVVKVYDGSIWFEFPAAGGFGKGEILAMVDSALNAGIISLDASPTGGASDDF